VLPPQPFIDNYLVRIEVAQRDLYLSNRDVNFGATNIPGHSQYVAQFEARNSITTGNGIYAPSGFYLTPDGDFGTANKAKVILHAPDISILPRSDFGAGELDLYYDYYKCGSNPDYRMANPNANNSSPKGNTVALAENNLALAPNAVT